MQVFLIGFMGAGKSSVGKRLAARLELPFIDMDHAIEKQEGKSISELFENNGETHFRNLEREWINGLNTESAVVSLGGGTPCQDEIMDLLNKKGLTVYVKASIGILVSRLGNAKSKRPLIDEIKDDSEKLTSFVDSLLSEREVHYNRAKLIFDGSDVNAENLEKLAEQILSSAL